jgi:hypothetical protein
VLDALDARSYADDQLRVEIPGGLRGDGPCREASFPQLTVISVVVLCCGESTPSQQFVHTLCTSGVTSALGTAT